MRVAKFTKIDSMCQTAGGSTCKFECVLRHNEHDERHEIDEHHGINEKLKTMKTMQTMKICENAGNHATCLRYTFGNKTTKHIFVRPP